MHAPFDNTVDIYGGPDGPSPGVLLATKQCRVVPADAILFASAVDPPYFGYVTIDGYAPRGCFLTDYTHEFEAWNPCLGDQLAIPSGTGPPNYRVLWTERVIWQGQSYFRSQVNKEFIHTSGSINSVQCFALPLTAGQQMGVDATCTQQNYFFWLNLPAGTYHVTWNANENARGEIRQGVTYGGSPTLLSMPFPGTYTFVTSGVQAIWCKIDTATFLGIGPVTITVT